MALPIENPHRTAGAALSMLLIVLIAYGNCFTVPFIFDDTCSILENASILQWNTSFSPPSTSGETVSGRPLLNFSFRLNYLMSGFDLWSYHLVNVLIHYAAGLLLFGIVRRTLLLHASPGKTAQDAHWLAWLISAIWLVHPMATESVTYIVQRAESLMGMFYFLVLYCFMRGVETRPDNNINTIKPGCRRASNLWLALSWVSCLAGMACKEVMITAPIAVFVYDRTFFAGTFKSAWLQRWRVYLAYASTWILLGWLMYNTDGRGSTTGFTGEMTWWAYGLTQCWAIVRYIRLAFWPSALVFDYGTELAGGFGNVWPSVLILAILASISLVAFWRIPKIGCLCVIFFLILLPTSSVVPIVTQVVAEHRMYLPLAVIISLAVLCLHRFIYYKMAYFGVPLVVILAIVTILRNHDYRNEKVLWEDIVAKYPASSRANNNYGSALIEEGLFDEGLHYCRAAVQLNPHYGDAFNNIGYGYSRMGQYEEALKYFDDAMRLHPSSGEVVLYNWCFALFKLGRYKEAWEKGMAALQIKPQYALAYVGLGNVSAELGNYIDAEFYYGKALNYDPRLADAWNNWGNLIARQPGRLEEALEYYKKAVLMAPSSIESRDNVARLLVLLGRSNEAIEHFEEELRLNASLQDARKNLADALFGLGRLDAATIHYKEWLSRDSGNAGTICAEAAAHLGENHIKEALALYRIVLAVEAESEEANYGAGNALLMLGVPRESIPHYRAVLSANPGHSAAYQNLALALGEIGNLLESVSLYEQAEKLWPEQAPIYHNHAIMLARLGRLAEAMALEKKALSIKPDLQQSRQHLEVLRKAEEKNNVHNP